MTIIDTDDHVMASDEEIARALQEQFRREEEEENAARRSTREATAPPLSLRSEDSDAVVARRLVDEELRAAEAFETSMYPVGGGGDDEEVARRMEQEARDAALAASLAQQDVVYSQNAQGIDDPASREIAQNIMAQDQATQRRRRRRRSLNSCLICLCAVAFSFVLFRYLLPRGSAIVGGGGGSGNPFDDLADWFGWEGNDYKKGENIPWAGRTRNGLNLRVLNNLDEKWQDVFFTVINEWDSGEPDAVSFVIERIVDPSCRMVPGAMVVCNDNYGRTSWRGINELMTNNGYIISSIAKLNDYYLEGRSGDLRQYVCCHEIGHGLGLGHTDEGVYNADLGECMDYTVNPGVNKRPGKTNFEALQQMYGTVDGGRRSVRGLEGNNKTPGGRMDLVEYSPDDIEWRMLRRTERSEHYEGDLGDGRKVLRVLDLV